jgi:hypothetical protein
MAAKKIVLDAIRKSYLKEVKKAKKGKNQSDRALVDVQS